MRRTNQAGSETSAAELTFPPYPSGSPDRGWGDDLCFDSSQAHRHLLDLERLTPDEVRLLLDTAALFKEATGGCRNKLSVLGGRTIVNLFFENSTRTRTSFSLAARRLGADVVDFSASTSSLSKGESFIDTARNLEAMGIDAVVVRHSTPGTPHLLAQHLRVGESVNYAAPSPLAWILFREFRRRAPGSRRADRGDTAHDTAYKDNRYTCPQAYSQPQRSH